MTAAATHSATILTMSFRGDFGLCAMLCESVDRFADRDIEHILIVPTSDMPLFQPLAHARRRVVSEDTLLPGWFKKFPLPSQTWRKRLRLPRRDFYVTPYSLPVRGWIAQQILKIGAAANSSSEIIFHVDSDALFVRPFATDLLFRDADHARLYRQAPAQIASHRAWHLAVSKLLGLPPDEFHDGDYIDSMVVWRQSVVQKMIARIESVTGKNWQVALARTPHFSEYVLYGVFAERVLGLSDAKLAMQDFSLCTTRWTGAINGESDKADFIASLDPRMIGCCVQSTIALSLPERRDLYERAIIFAQQQDARA